FMHYWPNHSRRRVTSNRHALCAFLICCLLWGHERHALAQPVTNTAPPQVRAAQDDAAIAHWCAPELIRVGDNVCFFEPAPGRPPASQPSSDRRGTLVIFLHSLIGAEPDAAWEQQRRM